MRRGRDLLFESMEQLGIGYLFGNPGTTELPVVDGCSAHPKVKYVETLHEDIAVGMAAGYAQASGRVGVANLHVAPGLAHGMGNIYNVHRGGTPVVITAGQLDTRAQVLEPVLWGHLVEQVRSMTKWAHQVQCLEEWPLVLQRAFKVAMTPPTGPVFLGLPTNVMLAETELRTLPVTRISGALLGDEGETRHAAQLLARARKPTIIVGDGVGLSRAWDEIVTLAEAIGAPVYTAGAGLLANFPSRHPYWAGTVPGRSAEIRELYQETDVVFYVGVSGQVSVAPFDVAGPFAPPEVAAIFLHDNPWELGKNQSGAAVLFGEVKVNLARLNELLSAIDKPDLAARGRRAATAGARRKGHWERIMTTNWAQTPIAPARVAAELADALPPRAVVVSEAVSNSAAFVNLVPFNEPSAYVGQRGGGLGYGNPAALGHKLGAPDRPTVCVTGDGAFLYYPQVLWTAASLKLPVTYIVLNNTSYRVLKQMLQQMGGPWGPPGSYTPGLDINRPDVDFVSLAHGYSVQAERVIVPDELHSAIERGLAAGEPYLIEVIVDKAV